MEDVREKEGGGQGVGVVCSCNPATWRLGVEDGLGAGILGLDFPLGVNLGCFGGARGCQIELCEFKSCEWEFHLLYLNKWECALFE